MGSESHWTLHELTPLLDDGSEGHSGPKADTHLGKALRVGCERNKKKPLCNCVSYRMETPRQKGKNENLVNKIRRIRSCWR